MRSASRTTPRPVTPVSTPSGQSIAGFSVRSSAGKTARWLQFAEMPLTPVSQRHRQQRFPAAATRSPHTGSVSFYSADADAVEFTPRRRKLDANEKAGLQNELAVLERMLWDLEAETERLGLQPQTPRGGERSIQTGDEGHSDQGPDEAGSTERFADEGEEDEGDEDDEDSQGETARRISFNDETLDDATIDHHEDDSRLGEICHRSLSIGLGLTRKMDQVRHVRSGGANAIDAGLLTDVPPLCSLVVKADDGREPQPAGPGAESGGLGAGAAMLAVDSDGLLVCSSDTSWLLPIGITGAPGDAGEVQLPRGQVRQRRDSAGRHGRRGCTANELSLEWIDHTRPCCVL